jgi:hypothetical protein
MRIQPQIAGELISSRRKPREWQAPSSRPSARPTRLRPCDLPREMGATFNLAVPPPQQGTERRGAGGPWKLGPAVRDRGDHAPTSQHDGPGRGKPPDCCPVPRLDTAVACIACVRHTYARLLHHAPVSAPLKVGC